MSIPHLEEYNNTKRLIVNDKPFLMLAGEVHNSNSSSIECMEQVWEKAETLGMNSLLLPVTWEMVEPQEGVFDFSIVDGIVEQARARGKKIGLLWFGTWKNAQCMYAPPWVKRDLKRFRRGQIVKGKNKAVMPIGMKQPYTTLSYLCEAAMEADARAFGKLMAYIRDIDEKEQTVITIQVENETGLLGAAREQSDEADALFAAEVPQDFAMAVAGCTGTWREVFGAEAEEAFSAYYISRYVGCVAAAGKKEYPIPMTVNAWLDKPGEAAGEYPSGGPVAKNHRIWKYNAASIDIYCPDIYVPYFNDVCRSFTGDNNPLYIPECATHSYAGSRMVYTVGRYHTLCYAPFGFENMGKPFGVIEGMLFGMDTSDPALQIPQSVKKYREYSDALSSMMLPLIEAYGTERLQASSAEVADENWMDFGEYKVQAVFEHPFVTRRDGVCLGLKAAEDEFYFLADGCGIEIFSGDETKPNVDYLLVEEGGFADGKWKPYRRLNGDETQFLKCDNLTLIHMKVFNYN
ncbi:MAG: DUF5597 domain-containing protein [Lachnospiraceae bacterium]|nr:DUF5597 domain-containing protein [Lachnospiraceae bacterium]